MKVIAALAFAVATAACTGDEAPPPARQAQLAQESEAQPTLPQRKAFPERAANLTPPPPQAKAPKPAPEPPPAPAPVVVPAGPPPLPFSYVGKLVEGGRRSAVLARDQAVFVVRTGDSLAGRYRVQSVREEQVVLLNLEFGVAQPLAFSGPAVPVASLETSRAGPLQVAGPSQVAIGEQFSLTVSLDEAAESGSVEVRFDPKVLQLRGSGRDGESVVNGAVQLEAPSTMQFRVVAQTPTATVIRVAATSADGDGNIRVAENPAAHRLAIVPR